MQFCNNSWQQAKRTEGLFQEHMIMEPHLVPNYDKRTKNIVWKSILLAFLPFYLIIDRPQCSTDSWSQRGYSWKVKLFATIIPQWLIGKYTNPARGILDFCKQKFCRPLLCSQWTRGPWNMYKLKRWHYNYGGPNYYAQISEMHTNNFKVVLRGSFFTVHLL